MMPLRATSPQGEDDTRILTGWRFRAVVWSVLVAAAGYLGFALWSGWSGVADAVGNVGIIGIGIALMLSLVNYSLRFVRWQAYLRAMDHPVPWWPSLKIYLAGFALTTTPGKGGELLRSALLKRWDMPYPKSVAAFLSDRLSDLLALVLLALFGLAAYPAARPLIAIGAAAVTLFLLVIASRSALEGLERSIQGTTRIGLLVRHLLQVLLQARRCHSICLLVGATGLSVLAWAAEAWAFHLVLQRIGFETSLPFAAFVYAISMLAGALSFLPAGLGGAEAVMVGLLAWKGQDIADAAAATMVIRLATLWFAVGLGASCLYLLRGSGGNPAQSARMSL
jgi:uncharacterized protein (TIRG00374 family)